MHEYTYIYIERERERERDNTHIHTYIHTYMHTYTRKHTITYTPESLRATTDSRHKCLRTMRPFASFVACRWIAMHLLPQILRRPPLFPLFPPTQVALAWNGAIFKKNRNRRLRSRQDTEALTPASASTSMTHRNPPQADYRQRTRASAHWPGEPPRQVPSLRRCWECTKALARTLPKLAPQTETVAARRPAAAPLTALRSPAAAEPPPPAGLRPASLSVRP